MISTFDQLADVRRRLAYLKTEEASLVAQLRRDGESWGRIAQALGTSRQNAQKRFAERGPDLENVPLSDPLFDPLCSAKQE